MPSLPERLALANRVLANEGVLDAFGHVTVREPGADELYVSNYRSPALVTPDDVVRMRLDGEVLTEGVDEVYSENVIHRAVYRNRDDVDAVVHHHAPAVLPFAVTGVPVRPVVHNASIFADGVPVFRDYGPARGRLVVEEAEGQRMAEDLGDRRAQLLFGHGANVVGKSVEEAVVATTYFVGNAEAQFRAELLGEPAYYEGDAGDGTGLPERTVRRVWDHLVERLPGG